MKKKYGLTAAVLSAMLVISAMPIVSAAGTDSTEIRLGDVNGDGYIDVLDATLIQKYSSGKCTLGQEQLDRADVNGDGEIDVLDAALIQKYASEKIDVFPREEQEATTEAQEPTEEPTQAPTEAQESTEEPTQAPTEAQESTEEPTQAPTEATDPTEVDPDAWKENTGTIVLSNDGITVTGEGIYVDGNTVYITEGGDWAVTGTCDDGMIYINTGEEKDDNDKVKLRLSGMSLTNTNGPAIYFDRCKKAFITLESGTVNTVADGSAYAEAYADAKGAIQSDDSLEIKGKGTLNVTGNYKHGISGSDDIVIENGVINVLSAVKDGLHANDYITLSGKNIKLTVNASGDAVESEGYFTSELASLDLKGGGKGINANGSITLTSGTFTIDTTDDCINSNDAVVIEGGTFDLKSADDAVTGVTVDISGGAFGIACTGKGIKATTDLTIGDGEFTINSTDDSVHSNGNVTIEGGTFKITSGDDGVHADTTLTINGGTIEIYKSYEGIEGNDIIVNDGTVYVVASDDGLNAAGGQDQSSQGGRPGQNPFSPGESSNNSITVNNGYVYVVASGDGIDSNGALNFNGGTVVVQGPSTGGNFSVDADGTVGFNGGTVIAICSANAMWEDINGKLGNAVFNKSAGTVSKNGVIAVTDSSGNVLSAVRSQLSGSVGVLYYTSRSSSLTSCKAVINGTYSGTFDDYGYAEGGTISGGTSSTLSQSTSGGGGQFPGGPGGRW